MRIKNANVINPNNDIEQWPKQLSNLNIFEKGQLTKEDQNKTQLYKIRDKFEKDKKFQ